MFLETLRKKKGVLHKVRHSIRTRYSLATAFFLLLILGLFYVGGRIVLVHLVKDAETQVREIGTDINRLAIRNAEKVKRHLDTLAPEQTTLPINTYLGLFGDTHVALALRLDASGRFVEGFVAGGHAGSAIRATDVAEYTKHFPLWVQSCVEKDGRVSAPLSASLLRPSGRPARNGRVCWNGPVLPTPDQAARNPGVPGRRVQRWSGSGREEQVSFS